MPSDFQVRRLEYEDINEESQRLRALGLLATNQKTFDIVGLLYHVAIPSLAKIGKQFSVEVHDDRLPFGVIGPAYVDLTAKVLHILSDVLREARNGVPHARFIVAHEIGHMILHKDQVMSFSDDKAVQLHYLPDQQSAEWQANTFALTLLLPDQVIFDTRNLDLDTASIVTLVASELIDDRRYEYEMQHRVSLETFTGDQCDCGSFLVLQLLALTMCKACGKTA